jgi:hypothetical protein
MFMEIPAWVPAVFDIGWNTLKMVTVTLLISLTEVNRELPPQNAVSRKLMHSSQKTKEWQGNCSASRCLTQCRAGGNKRLQGTRKFVVARFSDCWWMSTKEHTWICHCSCISGMLPRGMTSYWTPWLVVEADFIILTVKQNDRAWNSITLHLMEELGQSHILWDSFWHALGSILVNFLPRKETLQFAVFIRSTVNNFEDWPHSGAVMHYSGYVEPRDGALSFLLSSQQEAVACVRCIQKESHCCEG